MDNYDLIKYIIETGKQKAEEAEQKELETILKPIFDDLNKRKQK